MAWFRFRSESVSSLLGGAELVDPSIFALYELVVNNWGVLKVGNLIGPDSDLLASLARVAAEVGNASASEVMRGRRRELLG